MLDRPGRDDLAARLEEAFDLERLEMAQASVRQRVEPHTWEAFRLTALEGRSGAERPPSSRCRSAPSSRPKARCSRCSARRSNAWK